MNVKAAIMGARTNPSKRLGAAVEKATMAKLCEDFVHNVGQQVGEIRFSLRLEMLVWSHLEGGHA